MKFFSNAVVEHGSDYDTAASTGQFGNQLCTVSVDQSSPTHEQTSFEMMRLKAGPQQTSHLPCLLALRRCSAKFRRATRALTGCLLDDLRARLRNAMMMSAATHPQRA